MKSPSHRCLFSGSLAREPDACLEGNVNFELSEVVELDQQGETEVLHLFPVRVRASGELGARALDDLRPGDRVLIRGGRTEQDTVGALEMEAYEVLSRASRTTQKNMVVPNV